MDERAAASGSRWRRVWSVCALLVASACVVVALVVASVVGNRVNGALPRGFGLVGMVVTVGLMSAVLVLLISPKRLWRRMRVAAVAFRTSWHQKERVEPW